MAEQVLAKERVEEKALQEKLIADAKRKKVLSMIIPYAGLAFLIVFFIMVTAGNFISLSNLENLINQSYTLIIVAVGAAFVYAWGGMDMSIGAIQAFTSVIIAVVALQHVLPIWMILPISIIVAAAVDSLNAIISLATHVPVFVVSLCINYICTGIVAASVSQSDIYISYQEYSAFNNTAVKAIVLLAVIAVGYYMFEYTRLGKGLKAVGGNINTAKQSGINAAKYIVIAYAILGAAVGVISFFALTRTGIVSASTGNTLMLDVLTAIVLGGFPMAGGSKAKISSAIVGAVTVSVLTNGLTLWGVDPNYISGIKGILFLIIVYLSYERKKGEIFN